MSRDCLHYTKKLSPFAVDAVYSQLHSSIQIGDRDRFNSHYSSGPSFFPVSHESYAAHVINRFYSVSSVTFFFFIYRWDKYSRDRVRNAVTSSFGTDGPHVRKNYAIFVFFATAIRSLFFFLFPFARSPPRKECVTFTRKRVRIFEQYA